MANTFVDYTATASQTDFAFSFPFLEDSHVVVEIDGINKTLTTDYTIVTSPSTKVVLNSGATAGQLVRVKRVSGFDTDLVDFVNGSVLNEADLDKAYLHNRYLNEEAAEGNNASMQIVGGGTDFNAESKKIVNLATPTVGTDAANKNYIDNRVALGSTNLNAFDKSTHTGDNTLTEFTLSFTPQSNTAEAYIVTIDGVVQTPTTAYSVSTSTNKITFTSAPPTSANIVVVPIGTTADLTTSLSLAGINPLTSTGSTTARSLADRFGDVVNVKDFGATGNGSTDDRAAIQSAIDYVEAIGNEYKRPEIVFPQGTYVINSSYPSASLPQGTYGSYSSFETKTFGLVFRDITGVKLKGLNNKVHIQDTRTSPDATIAFVKAGSARDFSMENFLITGNNTSSSNAPDYLLKSYSEMISQSYFRNIELQGARLACTDLHIWGTQFQKCKASYGHVDGFVFNCADYTGTFRGMTSINMIDCYAFICHRYGFNFEGFDTSNPSPSYVLHNNVYYYAINDHTSSVATEPGVGADWSDNWKIGNSNSKASAWALSASYSKAQGWGLQGYQFCSLRTCYADKIGYNPASSSALEASPTYLASSAAIRINNSRNFVLENIGLEDVLRAFSIKHSKSLAVDHISIQNPGYLPYDASKNVGTFGSFDNCREVTVQGWSQDPDKNIGAFNSIISFGGITGYHEDERLTMLDGSVDSALIAISPSSISISDTSNLINHKDLYDRNALRSGNLLRFSDVTTNGVDSAIQKEALQDNIYTKQYKLSTGAQTSRTQEIVSVTNADYAKDGVISVLLRITAVDQTSAPSNYVASASIGTSASNATAPNATTSGGFSATLSLAWDTSSGTHHKLVLTYGNNYQQMFFVEVLASSHIDTDVPLYTFL